MHFIIKVVSFVLLLDTVRAACHADCDLHGSCDPVDEVMCLCDAGFHGLNCQTDGNTDCGVAGSGSCASPAVCSDGACAADCPTCENSGTCVTTGLASSSARVCKCPAANVGATCNLVCPTPACDGVFKKCVPNVGDTAGECVCKLGLSGTDCTTVDCSLGDPCLNGGTCNATPSQDVCTCDPATQAGEICQHACTNACTNGGTCVVISSGTECSCPNTHVGATCQQSCSCANGGTCVEAASGGVSDCTCPNTYVGDTCQQLCPTCENGGTCVEALSGTDAQCSCPSTHVGATCQYACPMCDVFKMCALKSDSSGAECVCKLGLDGTDCTTVNCTEDDPCLNGGTCNATPDPDECTCPTTHTGAICQDAPCVDGAPCLNGGTCADAACTCDATHAGDTCQLTCDPACTGDMNCTEDGGAGKCLAPCVDGAPCLNGGTCADGACTCDVTKYAGNTCQLSCTPACTGVETCKEEAGAGKCSGAATIVASVALILGVVARRLF